MKYICIILLLYYFSNLTFYSIIMLLSLNYGLRNRILPYYHTRVSKYILFIHYSYIIMTKYETKYCNIFSSMLIVILVYSYYEIITKYND